jgi:Protein of unknown function (DUF3667)
MSIIICKNCNTHFKGNFCSQCGQSAKEDYINAKYFLHDIPHSILHIDKGFFYTLKQLFISPGKTLSDYLAGKRVKHFKPFAFVVLLSTICTLLIKGISYLYHINVSYNLIQKYPSILIFIMIPVLSLVTWLFFRRKEYNYWEHFLVNTYLAAYLNIFFLLIRVYQFTKFHFSSDASVNYTIFITIFMTYYGFAFGRLMYKKQTSYKHVLYIFVMNLFLSLLYMTAFSLSGYMSKWWE